MTTIRLSTQSIDLPVTFSSGDIGNLFDQSLTDMIAERVNNAILLSRPDETAIAEALGDNIRFTRTIRNQVMESIDYSEIRRNLYWRKSTTLKSLRVLRACLMKPGSLLL
jgi:hypothetical protein